MNHKKTKSIPAIFNIFNIFTITLLIILAALLSIIISPEIATASTIVEVNPVNTPNGAVILIIDGLSSPHIYPELTPYAIDGTKLDKPVVHNISKISENSARVIDIRAPHTYTEAGHSVIVTGYSEADSEIVGCTDSTIFDMAHDNEYLAIAILERGDFYEMQAEQDIILYDKTNSINNPTIEMSIFEHTDASIPQDVVNVMKTHADGAYDYVNRFPESSKEQYDAYNMWTLDTAGDVIKSMNKNAPDQKYILIINAGAIDSSGHHRKNNGYIENIEGLDAAIMPFYELCLKNNLVFVLTADHGMAFTTNNTRGGHQSEKYSVTPEAQMIPLIIHAPNVKAQVIEGQFGQEDIAPTLLSLLNIPNELKFADGTDIGLKDYVNIKVDTPSIASVELLKNGVKIAQASNDDEYLFAGLETGVNYSVLVHNAPGAPSAVMEKEVFADTDIHIEFTIPAMTSENGGLFQNMRHLIGGVLIMLINIIGLFVIAKILKE